MYLAFNLYESVLFHDWLVYVQIHSDLTKAKPYKISYITTQNIKYSKMKQSTAAMINTKLEWGANKFTFMIFIFTLLFRNAQKP